MNQFVRNVGRYRLLYLLLVTASAVALTNYLFDTNSERMPGEICFGLMAGAWLTVLLAWREHRPYLRNWSGGLTFCVVVVELVVVSLIRNAVFSCPIPPPTPAQLGYTRLENAVQADDLAGVQSALADGIDPNLTDAGTSTGVSGDYDYDHAERPLNTAVSRGNVQIAALLIEHGADVNAGDPAPLVKAAETGNVAMIRLLLHRGAPIRDGLGNDVALWTAVENNQVDAVNCLLGAGANPNMLYRDWEDDHSGKWTVLRLARRNDNIPIAKLLKKAGATE